MGLMSLIKRFMLFVIIWVAVFGAVCYIFPFHYFNEKFSEAYNIDQTQEIDNSQDVAVEDKNLSSDYQF